jgi:hypothetical protein
MKKHKIWQTIGSFLSRFVFNIRAGGGGILPLSL